MAYPHPSVKMRPRGPSQFDAAAAVLLERRFGEHIVDLHRDARGLHRRTWDELYSASRLVALGDTALRIPSAEDHRRICASHFLRHGGWRPLWLCDVAAALEAGHLDPATCIEGSRSFASSLPCVLAATRDLLGARLDAGMAELADRSRATWLQRVILREWSRPRPRPAPLGRWIGGRRLVGELAQRWPNEIQAMARCAGLFDNRPRLPYQLAAVALRGWQVLAARLSS